jgi:hypothetical protein
VRASRGIEIKLLEYSPLFTTYTIRSASTFTHNAKERFQIGKEMRVDLLNEILYHKRIARPVSTAAIRGRMESFFCQGA